MKRVTFAVIIFIALLTLAAPLVLAEDGPPPLPPGGCGGSDCK
jgi:hypothetical protein